MDAMSVRDEVNAETLLAPEQLWSRGELLATPCPVPALPGVYAWYFRDIPPGVPTASCVTHGDLTLLYLGIAPHGPPRPGQRPSRATLRSRLRQHLQSNAEGSTLRLTLGCLLASTLDLELRRVGSGRRRTFTAAGEAQLSAWLDRNAFVTWLVAPEPWIVETVLIRAVSLPLNLDQNEHHPFYPMLTQARRAGRSRADDLPIVS